MRAADAVRAFHSLTKANGMNPRIQWAVYYAPEESAVCIRGTMRTRRDRHTDRRMLMVDGLDEGLAVERAKREISDIAYVLSVLVDRRE